MKKLTWLLIAVLSLSCIAVCCIDATQTEASAETAELRYYDAPLLSAASIEEIHFTGRVVTQRDTDGGAPLNNSTPGLDNCCGPLAGTNAVAFYDKYYENLIPNYSPCYPDSGTYYMSDYRNTNPVLLELYDLMKCNVGSHGVNEEGFKNGLQTYFNKRGLTITYRSAAENKQLNYNTCVEAVRANKVIVLFTTPGYIYDIAGYSNYDVITKMNISGNHIMLAYGFMERVYYQGSDSRKDYYVRVATGLGDPDNAYYKIDSTNLEAAYVLDVA